MLSQHNYFSSRTVRWILLIYFIASSLLGAWSCTSNQMDPPSSAPDPTLLPFVSGPQETGTTPIPPQTKPSFDLRGIWIHPKSVATKEKADETLDRVQAGNFNATFLLIFIDGYVYYDSAIAEKRPFLAPDYDPLRYFVTEAHRRGLQVHVWFAVGRIGTPYGDLGPILSQHPEWGMVDAGGNSQIHWLNFARPDARQFMRDLILEVVQNYDVDGVHLDYIRYPGPEWSFDPYSINVLATGYDVNLESLRYTQLPAYGFFHGNPLADVGTAEVLAEFDDGLPAVLLNSYGRGKVVVLNWHAEEQQIAAPSEILKRSIEFLRGKNGQVYIFRSEINEAEYTTTYFKKNQAWLKALGWEPIQITEEDLAALDTDSVLVLPNIYIIEATTAAELLRFVENGGGLIFIDGPVKAMIHDDIRAITGMRSRRRYFEGEKALLAVGKSELIPNSDRELNVQAYHEQTLRWNTFREESVSALVQDIYQRVKATKPEVQVSAAVYRKQAWASGVFQNWYGWLANGDVDFVVPMAYVSETLSLESLINEWQTNGDIDRTAVGLAVANFNDRAKALKTPKQLLSEVELIQQRGINGVVIFDIEHISDDQIEALATGPFAPQDSH